jgi:hypothetical protein
MKTTSDILKALKDMGFTRKHRTVRNKGAELFPDAYNPTGHCYLWTEEQAEAIIDCLRKKIKNS